MLSNEEKKAIEYLKIEYEKLMKEDNILFPLYKSDAKRLIDIIEKQSKEIEELNKSDESKEQSSMKYYNLYKELVDKIKAKIEYKKDKLRQIQNSNDRYRIMCLQVEIDILQSLLEKE